MEDLHAFLQGNPDTWTAFAAGFPIQRGYRSEAAKSLDEELQAALDMVSAESDGRKTFVLQLPSEAGAGATTLLRNVAFEAAGRGYPTVVLRPEQIDINLEELLAFVQALSEASLTSRRTGMPPILIVCDVEHYRIPELSQLPVALASHGRRAVILQAVSFADVAESSESRRNRRTRLAPLKAQACPKRFRNVLGRSRTCRVDGACQLWFHRCPNGKRTRPQCQPLPRKARSKAHRSFGLHYGFSSLRGWTSPTRKWPSMLSETGFVGVPKA